MRKPVPRELAAGILEECKKLNLHVQFYNENSYFFEKDNEFSRFYQRMTGIQGKETENLLQLLEREEPIKLLVIDNQDRIRGNVCYFKELFGRNLQISFSRPEYLEFTNAEATKGNALAVLGQMLDISREEIIAIGDSHNDISMIEYAGLGIAMGNAIDELKHHADYVTKGNDENGVAEAVERFILKRSELAMGSISIEDMLRELDLEVVYKGKSLSIDIETSDINRPGLQFAGFFDYFAAERVQVIGKVEMTYLDSMDPEIRSQRLDRFFGSGIPCVLISRDMEVPPYLIESAKNSVALLFGQEKQQPMSSIG